MKKSVFTIIQILIITALSAASALAVPVTYSVQLNVNDAGNNTAKLSQAYNQQCDNTCTFSNTLDAPQNATIINYTISYPAGDYKVYFASNKDEVVQQNDSIIVEIIQAQANVINETTTPPAPQISCTNNNCDPSCVKCDDNNCHAQPFTCVSELTLDKITPETTKAGIAQLNILLRNTGTVDLTDIYAEVSGDGVTTLEKISMDKLVVGDKDYAFVKINATKAGKIDLVIKIYIGNQLRSKLIGQLSVTEDKVPVAITPTKESQYNITQLSSQLVLFKANYSILESDYQARKADYVMDTISDRLKEAYSYLSTAELAFYDGDYKRMKVNLDIAQERINAIQTALANAPKKQKRTIDVIKENLTYIASFGAAIITIITSITLIQKHLNKERLARLTDKVKFTKKDEALAKKDKELEKKDKAFTKKDKQLAKEIKEIKKVVKIKTKKNPKNNGKKAGKSNKPGKKGDDDLEGGMTV